MKKSIITTIILIFLIFNTSTATATQQEVLGSLSAAGAEAKYKTTSYDKGILLSSFIGNIIEYILGFLGVIFLVLLIYSGFKWMTARGDSDTINKSKAIIINAVIGLIIVLMSYGITFYVVSNLASSTIDNSGFK